MTEYQWQCLVRYVLHLSDTEPEKARTLMSKVYDKSPERWAKLKQDCRRQWDRGNRGRWGEWL